MTFSELRGMEFGADIKSAATINNWRYLKMLRRINSGKIFDLNMQSKWLLYGVLILLILYSMLFSGVPEKINVQGRLTDPAGVNLLDGNYEISLSIWDHPTNNNNMLWKERFSGSNSVSIKDGVFQVFLGDGTKTGGSEETLSTVFNDGTRWLQISVKKSDETFDELWPRLRMESVGYALRADVAEKAKSSDGNFEISESQLYINRNVPSSNNSGHIVLQNFNGQIGDRTLITSSFRETNNYNDGKYTGGAYGFVKTGDGSRKNDFVVYVADNDNVDLSIDERFRITNAGNVGIGTDDPEAKLDVVGADGLIIRQGHSANGALIIKPYNAPDHTYHEFKAGNSEHIEFNLGSGAKFKVIGSEGLTVADGRSGWGSLEIKPYTTNHLYHEISTGKKIIFNSGNIGIGTTTPSAKLEVAGSIKTSGFTIPDSINEVQLGMNNHSFYIDGAPVVIGGKTLPELYDLYIYGDAYASGQIIAAQGMSDRRLKNIISDCNYGLAEILRINPIRFKFKENPLRLPTDKEFISVIAQDIQEIIPEAVGQGPEDYLNIKIEPILWTMLNAIKELNQKNENLKQSNDDIKQENTKLKNMITDLVSRVEALEAK